MTQWLLVGFAVSFSAFMFGVVGFILTLVDVPSHEPFGFILDIVSAADTFLGILGLIGTIGFGLSLWLKNRSTF